ncbi:MAG TPA: glycosyltransferase family 1 protein [Bacteroidetes bacterium]|nr:glycosyltransferase family 1 protein [Bacteroidota bacterium]
MKIAVNTRFLLKGKLEGIGFFTREVVKRLVEQHPEHEFIFFFDRPFDPSFIFGKNVTPVVLFPPARHPLLFLWWFEWSVARELKKRKADVFLSPDNFLSLRAPTRTILVTHDLAHLHLPGQQSFFQKKYYEILSSRFQRRADHIVTVSHFTKKDIVEQYGISPEKISVACNGCSGAFGSLSAAERQEVRDRYAGGQPYFLYVGAIHPRKNVHRLIRAFSAFKKATGAPVLLLIAGRFAWKAGGVKSAFERSAFQEDIRFLGYIPDSELPKLMAGAFALTYVSLFEGFGIPILEAMYSDVPVVTSNLSSMPEVAGDAALLVNPYSEKEIAQAMQQLWDNVHLRKRLIATGREQRKKFTWQKATDVVYTALADGR